MYNDLDWNKIFFWYIWQLTTPIEDSELARIAQEISVEKLRCIAVEYLRLPQVDLDNMQQKHGADKYGFSLDILINWRNRNPVERPREVRTFIVADPWTMGAYHFCKKKWTSDDCKNKVDYR